VVNCPLGHKLSSNLNGALNIRKSTNVAMKKPISFLVDQNRVA
jgi:transposase